MRRLICLQIILLLVLVAASAYSQDAGRAEGMELIHKLVPGNTVKYRVVQKVVGTRQMAGSSTTVPVDTELTQVIRVRCARMLPDKSLELLVDVESGSLKIAGRESGAYRVPKEVRTLHVTPYGRLIDTSTQSEDAEIRRSPIEFAFVESMALITTLPEKSAAVGDSWDADILLSSDPSSKVRLTSSLKKLAASAGEQVADIAAKISTLPRDDENAPAQRGTREGQVDLRFSADRGMLLSAKGEIKLSVAIRSEVPSMPGQNAAQGERFTTWNLGNTFSVEIVEDKKGAK